MRKIDFKALYNKLSNWRTRKETRIKFNGKEWWVSEFGETLLHGHKYIVGTRFEPDIEGFRRVDLRIYEYEWNN